jgi:hypothetical protein
MIPFHYLEKIFWLHRKLLREFKEKNVVESDGKYFIINAMDADGVSGIEFYNKQITTLEYAYFIDRLL